MARRTIAVPGRETLLTGWGRTAPSRATLLRPSSLEQLQHILSSRPPRGSVARGLGRSYGDPAQNAGGLVFSMTGFDRILAFDPRLGRVDVEAGVSLDTLIRRLVPQGWFVPVTPGTRFVTVGGAIAADIHGKNHHRDGSFGRSVVDFDLVTPTGIHRHVSRENDPQAFAATVGGMGLTGVVVRATLQLLPIETSRMRVDTARATNLDNLMQRMKDGDDGYHYSVAWIDTLARGSQLGRGVLYRANHARVSDLDSGASEDPLAMKISPAPAIPMPFPVSAINLPVVTAFNEFWFRRHPAEERDQLQGLSAFFHQLDLVQNVNYIYGPAGLIQHQCVIPDGEEDLLRSIVERLSAARCPSFLAVLKRMGPEDGLISFPLSGWTLAVDVPALWDADGSFFDAIDQLVVKAGGRLYFAKDSRTRPELVPAMYPKLSQWREIAAQLDPNHLFRSDLDRRLNLRME